MDAFQAHFHQRWLHLQDPHVRDLAWLVDAPDLLNPLAPRWNGQIATVDGTLDQSVEDWLSALDRAPGALHATLKLQPFARLGRYAEQLMAFYLRHLGVLVAHGVQVRAEKNNTIGEFDFLLRQGGALVHWEFATKFYLLETSGDGREADYFVGPNLADTLGAKMRKIFDRQLALGQHPASQIHLPEPVTLAQALIKGWLFYHDDDLHAPQSLGVSAAHCRGFWCPLAEIDGLQAERYAILPRLQWLAPAKLTVEQSLDKLQLQAALSTHFVDDSMPVMVAALELRDGWLLEASRGFVVPDDWRNRAGERARLAMVQVA